MNGSGAATGALAGAGTGAMVGSVVPGIGTAIGAIGGGIIGGVAGLLSSNGSDDAAAMQADAANHATDVQYGEYQQQRADQHPWLQAGATALGQMQDPSFNQTFNPSDMESVDPGYNFRMQQGQQALERSAAARGGLMSGGTMKALTQYGQDYASGEYQNAYNRFTNDQTNRFNRLASVAQLGQTANGQLGAAGTNMANQVGENMMGAANARGAASIANSNMLGNTLGSIGSGGLNWAMQSQMMNRFAPNYSAMGGYQAADTGSSLGRLGGSSGGYDPMAGTYQSSNFGPISGG